MSKDIALPSLLAFQSSNASRSRKMPDGTFRRRRSSMKVLGEMTSQAIRARCREKAPRTTLLRHPILRTIYLVFFVLTGLIILVPLWTLLYLPRANRPRPNWTLKRCLRVRWSRRLCAVVARCEIDYLGRDFNVPLESESLAHSHAVDIPPAPASWLRGHPAAMLEHMYASRGSWVPQFIHRESQSGPWGRWNPPVHEHKEVEYGFTSVPGFWYDGKPEPGAPRRPRKQGEPVLLLFHGGGYVCGTAAETDLTSAIAKSMVVHTPIQHVLSVDYRLAPNAPWPLPLLDAISAYAYLVSEGVDERDLIIGGDSAGGHLALSLTRWLRDEGPFIGLRGPRALVTFSPWCDTGFTHQWEPEGFKHNADTDTIDDTFGPFASSLLLRALPESIMHESVYLSPASRLIPASRTGPNSFESFPPCFVVQGDAERLSLEITELFHRIKLARDDKRDTLVTGPHAVHDFVIFPWFAEEAAAVYERLDEWLRDLLSEDDSSDDDMTIQLDAELSPLPSPMLPSSPPLESPAMRPHWPASQSPSLPPLSPLSAFSPLSPFLRAERRASRSSRLSLKSAKSPRMAAVKDSPTLMMGDMRSEGFHLLGIHDDMPSLDLGAAVDPFEPTEEGTWHELGESDEEEESE